MYSELIIFDRDYPSNDSLLILTNHIMLITIAVILIILWALGLIAFPVLGWFIHILLVVAIILILIRLIQGRNPIA